MQQGPTYLDPNHNGQQNIGQNALRQQQRPQQKVPESHLFGSQHNLKNTPNGKPDFVHLDTKGYDMVSIGNGSGKSNAVIINEGYGGQDEVFVATHNKQNPFNPNTQGNRQGLNNKNKGGKQPCIQNGLIVDPLYCSGRVSGFSDSEDSDYSSKTFNVGNGYNNENVVILNTRRSPGYNDHPKQRKQVLNIYSQDGISYKDGNDQFNIGKGKNNKNWFSSFFGL